MRPRTKPDASLKSDGFYGSALPSKFLKDLAAGTDSLDVVFVGDSNTGSPSKSTMLLESSI